MVKRVLHRPEGLDAVFGALSDPTRRALVERLARGPAPVKELAAPLAMSLSAVMQHLAVLERGGLVAGEKTGRVRTFRLEPDGLRGAREWLAAARTTREEQLDTLGEVLAADARPHEERP